ncbi:hypothetical protein COO60DRAFT_106376 [Scenedesmus sp. NREL 46B-D3]|nr:hypothetical protein COO60DRAFT_106376 [Scenedesmus sp. NREL 46B-D3]
MERSKRKAGRGALELLSGADSDEYYEAPVRTPKAMKSDKVEKVRVWWPPTRDKERTGFSGAYWPASVQRKGTNFLEVQYDNGEREKVDPDNIFPFDVPIEFGKESSPLVVGEFVEVSNNSKTDPCAWVGCVESIGKKCLVSYACGKLRQNLCLRWCCAPADTMSSDQLLSLLSCNCSFGLCCTPRQPGHCSSLADGCTVADLLLKMIPLPAWCCFAVCLQITYPFHDSPKELIKQELLRRARVWDDLDWKYIEVGQRWKAGEVTSPIELNLLTEEEYYRHLKQLNGKSSGGKGSRGKKPAAAAAPPSESEGSDSVQQDDSSSGEEQQPPQKKQSTGRQRGRPRKPQHPTRSRLDEASNGTRETKEEKPTGARKRKPAAVRQA